MTTVDVLRRFNRNYTSRIGVLGETFLGTGRPLSLNRLMFEIGATEGGPTVRALRDRTGLDSGHLSRLLRRLEDDGLIETTTDPVDRRRRIVTLTEAGRTARQDLDDRSEALADRLIQPLTERQRARLTEALATADLLVRAATVEFRPSPPDDPAGRSAVARYIEEINDRFPSGYQVDGPVAAEPGSSYIVAISDGEPVAYGGIRPAHDAGTVEIKRMWVHDDWRGAGLGSRMLRNLESLAAENGATTIVLDTNEVLTEAISLYERCGYAKTTRYPGSDPHATHFFRKDLRPGDAVRN